MPNAASSGTPIEGQVETRATLSPREYLSWAGVLQRTWSEFQSDHIAAVAGGATFFCLLAIFPALGVFVSLYGLFANVEQARQQVLDLGGVLPQGAVSILSDQLDRLAHTPHIRLGWTFALNLVLSLWSSNAGMKSLIAGLNVAYEEQERRKFIALNAVSLALTLGGLLAAFAAAAFPAWLALVGPAASPWVLVLQWAVQLALVVVGLSVLYRYGPSRARPSRRWITAGSAFSAIAWLMMSVIFTVYVAYFGRYDKIYGALGAIIGFMTWIWLSLCVVLLGAELNSQFE
jgi:membrane protein